MEHASATADNTSSAGNHTTAKPTVENVTIPDNLEGDNFYGLLGRSTKMDVTDAVNQDDEAPGFIDLTRFLFDLDLENRDSKEHLIDLSKRDILDGYEEERSNYESPRKQMMSWFNKLVGVSRLSTTTSAPYYSKAIVGDSSPTDKRRQMLSWFKQLFGVSTINTTTKPNPTTSVPNYLENTYRMPNHFTTSPDDQTKKLNDVLVKLNNVLENINQYFSSQLSDNGNESIIIVKVPYKTILNRAKRDVSKVDTEKYSPENKSKYNETGKNVEPTTETVDYDHSKTTSYVSESKDGHVTATNNYYNDTTLPTNNYNEDTNTDATLQSDLIVKSGRRFDEDPTSMRNKLLSHISDIFNELKKRIAPLNNIKNFHANDKLYKIGYITANLDTLEINLNHLSQDMEDNKYVWDDRRVLDLFERMSDSYSVVAKLMDALEVLTAPLAVESEQPVVGLEYSKNKK